VLLAWLSRFCATILVSLLSLVVFALVLSQTVFSPSYLHNELQHAHAYDRLASSINKQIVSSNQGSAIPAGLLANQLQQVITPQLIQQKLDGTINQTKAYYDGNGPVPSIDLSPQANQLQATGLQLPQGTNLTKPIEIKPLAKVKDAKKVITNTLLAVVIALIVLLAAIVAIAVKRHSYKPLANIFISLAVTVGLSGLSMLLVAPYTNRWVTSVDSNNYTELVRDLVHDITHDIGLRLSYIALASLALGIAGRILIHYLAKQSKALPVAPQSDTPANVPPELPEPTSSTPLRTDETPKQTN